MCKPILRCDCTPDKNTATNADCICILKSRGQNSEALNEVQAAEDNEGFSVYLAAWRDTGLGQTGTQGNQRILAAQRPS